MHSRPYLLAGENWQRTEAPQHDLLTGATLCSLEHHLPRMTDT